MKNPSMNDTESEQTETPVDQTGHGTSDDPPVRDADALKRGLMLRVGIAVALIAALLGGLAILDDLNAPAKKPAPSPVAIAPTPPATPASAAGTDTTTEAATLQVPPLNGETGEATPSEPDRSAAAQESSEAPTLAPSAKEDTITPPPAQRPLTRPATPHLAMMRPGEAVSASRMPPPSTAATAALTRPPAYAASGQPHAPASRPLTQAAARSTTGSGLLLQLGVFSSTVHAEELRAKLELNGIPAQIESRVQVGPFASREEAEQMRDKLKKLGLEGGVLVATKK